MWKIVVDEYEGFLARLDGSNKVIDFMCRIFAGNDISKYYTVQAIRNYDNITGTDRGNFPVGGAGVHTLILSRLFRLSTFSFAIFYPILCFYFKVKLPMESIPILAYMVVVHGMLLV